MESEDLKSSKKRAEETLKAERMWSKEKESEVERLEAEVRSLAPGEMEVRVREVTEDPLTSAWRGGASLASDRDFRNLIVTKEEYMESGFSACQRRFYL